MNSRKKMTLTRRKSVSNEFEPNLFISLSLRVLLAILVTVIAIFLAKVYTRCELKGEKSTNVLKYWGVSHSTWNPKGSLRTMNRVFKNLGYKLVNASEGENWDVLWSIEYPFRTSFIHQKSKLYEPLFQMNFTFLPHQRINHIPGIFHVTNKMYLGIETESKYLLPTFEFPVMLSKFNDFVVKNPEAKFVEKNYNNRGVRLINLNEINYEESEKIYQVFLDNPFLIDGHAFDFGVYVLITSVNPLRIYRYAHENFIRFCPEEYHPFDRNERGKYVIDHEHISVFEMPSFEDLYFNYGNSFKLIFEHIIKERGFDVRNFWKNVDDAITSIILKNEKHFIRNVSYIKTQ